MKRIWILVLALWCAGVACAGGALRPYLAGTDLALPLETALSQVRKALEGQGFHIAGEATPVKGARILLLTHPEQMAAATLSPRGAFATLARVSVVESGGKVQVAAFNPEWMAASCRLSRPLSGVRQALQKALGPGAPFGCKEGKSEKELRDYHYMMGMPYFDEVVELAVYPDQAKALQVVEAGFKAQAGGCRKLARVDLAGGQSSLFSVALAKGPGADAVVLGTVDMGARRQVAHLPYELLVERGRVLMLHARFRIANSYPDLSMGTFMKIVKAPGGIEDALGAVARFK